MRLFLLSLGVLFSASVVGYVSIRMLAIREPVEIPPLPRGLWLSTLMLITSSVSMQTAVVAARLDRRSRLLAAMAATTMLGFGFLAVQTLCWIEWWGPMRDALGQAEHVFPLTGFYVLTGVHAVHVVGGLIPLVIVTARVGKGRYTAAGHAGIIYCSMYWHFLDAVWLVLFATLLVG